MCNKPKLPFSIKYATHLDLMNISHVEEYKELGISKQLFHQLLDGQNEPRAGIIKRIEKRHRITFREEDFDIRNKR